MEIAVDVGLERVFDAEAVVAGVAEAVAVAVVLARVVPAHAVVVGVLDAIVVKVVGILVGVAQVGVCDEDTTATATAAAAAAHVGRSALAETVVAFERRPALRGSDERECAEACGDHRA